MVGVGGGGLRLRLGPQLAVITKTQVHTLFAAHLTHCSVLTLLKALTKGDFTCIQGTGLTAITSMAQSSPENSGSMAVTFTALEIAESTGLMVITYMALSKMVDTGSMTDTFTAPPSHFLGMNNNTTNH